LDATCYHTHTLRNPDSVLPLFKHIMPEGVGLI
jgi:hypothetical protein